jgi:hypothetical protein
MSKMSCEAKEDITVIIHNICHYNKLQKKIFVRDYHSWFIKFIKLSWRWRRQVFQETPVTSS